VSFKDPVDANKFPSTLRSLPESRDARESPHFSKAEKIFLNLRRTECV
jgi:hypothetical protein